MCKTIVKDYFGIYVLIFTEILKSYLSYNTKEHKCLIAINTKKTVKAKIYCSERKNVQKA